MHLSHLSLNAFAITEHSSGFLATFHSIVIQTSKNYSLRDLHSLFLFSPSNGSADQALDRFAMKKFFDDKVSALMQPSQKRYFNLSSNLYCCTGKYHTCLLFTTVRGQFPSLSTHSPSFPPWVCISLADFVYEENICNASESL